MKILQQNFYLPPHKQFFCSFIQWEKCWDFNICNLFLFKASIVYDLAIWWRTRFLLVISWGGVFVCIIVVLDSMKTTIFTKICRGIIECDTFSFIFFDFFFIWMCFYQRRVIIYVTYDFFVHLICHFKNNAGNCLICFSFFHVKKRNNSRIVCCLVYVKYR